MNSADQLIYHASLLLDAQDVDGAIAALHEAIALAEIAGFKLQLLRARTLLGEVLIALGRDEEAIVQFRGVLAVAPEVDPDLIDQEVEAATAHLERLA